MPTRRINSASGIPTSACFRTATICSTLNRFCFTANLPSLGIRFCRKLTLEMDQKYRGRSTKKEGRMAKQRHTVEQIISKLRQAEVELTQGRSMGEVCRSLGVTEQTYYRWRKEYGGLKMDQAKRLKEVEQENTRLRRAVA